MDQLGSELIRYLPLLYLSKYLTLPRYYCFHLDTLVCFYSYDSTLVQTLHLP